MKEEVLVNKLLENVHDLVGRKDLKKVKTVKVQIGPLSKVNPSIFNDYYSKKIANTNLKNTPLHIGYTTIEITCYDCKRTFVTENSQNRCPDCGSEFTSHTSGKDVYLDEIELAA